MECEVQRVECGVWSAKCRVSCVECKVWSVKVWNVKCGV